MKRLRLSVISQGAKFYLAAFPFFPDDFFPEDFLLALLLLLFFAGAFFVGSFLRFVEATFFSSFSLIEFAMLLLAPLSDDFDFSPRLAASAAPAAICCFFDFAGIQLFRGMLAARPSSAPRKTARLFAETGVFHV
jgi:hypothetical protein